MIQTLLNNKLDYSITIKITLLVTILLSKLLLANTASPYANMLDLTPVGLNVLACFSMFFKLCLVIYWETVSQLFKVASLSCPDLHDQFLPNPFIQAGMLVLFRKDFVGRYTFSRIFYRPIVLVVAFSSPYAQPYIVQPLLKKDKFHFLFFTRKLRSNVQNLPTQS